LVWTDYRVSAAWSAASPRHILRLVSVLNVLLFVVIEYKQGILVLILRNHPVKVTFSAASCKDYSDYFHLGIPNLTR